MNIFIDANFFIYLNCFTDEYNTKYIEINNKYDLYTNVLVFDELIYISKKKYNVLYKDTSSFINNSILPFVNILDITTNTYNKAVKIMLKYKLKPSDSIHVASMLSNHIDNILTEDSDFNNIEGIKRVWL